MPSNPDFEALSQQAKFIFKGTVKATGAATMAEVPGTKNTLIVTGDEIIQAPDVIQAFAGKDITVQLGEGQNARVGQERIFYTNGWIYGTGLAVISVGNVAASDTAMKQVATAVAQRAGSRPSRW